MTDIIIPVKTPTLAKQRLAGVLAPVERAQLVLAMLADVLDAIDSVPVLTAWVVSVDQSVLDVARRHGARVVIEPVERGYNAAVEAGWLVLQNHHKRLTNVATIPGDVPLVSAADLIRLTSSVDVQSCVVRLAPSINHDGTNGLFLSSSDLLKPAFGVDSYQRYCNTCTALTLKPQILSNSTLSLDVDTPDDLRYLIELDTDGQAGRTLRKLSASAIGLQCPDPIAIKTAS